MERGSKTLWLVTPPVKKDGRENALHPPVILQCKGDGDLIDRDQDIVARTAIAKAEIGRRCPAAMIAYDEACLLRL